MTSISEKHKYFLFYGSLRSGFSERKQYDGLTTLRIETICGYLMYDLGEYPYVVISNKSSDCIVVEVTQVDNEQIWNDICELEFSAGYTLDYVSISEGIAGIFLFREKAGGDKIKDGNYEHIKKQYD